MVDLVQLISLQQLCDAIVSICTKMYNTVLNVCHEELRQGVKPDTNKVKRIKWLMTV